MRRILWAIAKLREETTVSEAITDPPARAGPGLRRATLGLAAVVCIGVSAFAGFPAMLAQVAGVLGLSLLLCLAAVVGLDYVGQVRLRLRNGTLAKLIEHDPSCLIITDASGEIVMSNATARRRFDIKIGEPLEARLRSVLPIPSAVLLKLSARLRTHDHCEEELVSRGARVFIRARAIGDDLCVWSVSEVRSETPHDGLSLPVLTLDRGETLVSMNRAARAWLADEPGTLKEICCGQNLVPGGVNRVRARSGNVSVLAVELGRTKRRTDLLLVPLAPDQCQADGSAFADLPVPLMRLTPSGRVVEVNRLASQLVGGPLAPDATIEQVMQGLGRPISNWLMETAEQTTVPKSEFLRLSRSDKEVFVQVTLNRVIRDGEVGLIAVLNDATELKTLEAQFVQSQKMQAVGQLAGGVAHDFNNLLTAISGHCDLLLLRRDQSDPDYGDLIQINQNANRAAALVGQLLAFSRKQTLRPEQLDLRDTLSDLIHLLNRLVGEKITLTLSHDPVLRPVRADKRQLEQVLMNLVVNARDAMPDGGEVRIETKAVRLETTFERDRATMPAGDYVSVKVIDHGMGIAPGKLQKVFEPFYTTKRTGEGTGLGLSTVYGIVKQTGGFIFVDSAPGKGATFTVFLPVSTAQDLPESSTPPAPESRATGQGEGVILLVEDEAPVRAFASRALRLRGYTVLEAHSAEAALALLDESDLAIDVFVTDVVMPGMDGPSWVRQALTRFPDVKVVFMSGYAEGAFGDAGPEIPNSVFLPKPFSLNQLTETVCNLMT